MSTSVIAAQVERRAAAVTTANVIVHVERLGPTYDTGWTHFSLNLSAALAADALSAAEVRTFLSPWRWPWVTLAVLGVDAAHQTVALPAGSIEVLLAQAPATMPGMAAALEAEQDEVIAEDASLAAFKTALDSPSERKTVRRGQHHWKSFLAHASTFPAPLPHSQDVKLCVSLRIRSEALAQHQVAEIVAAPIFTDKPFGARGPSMPEMTPWDVSTPDNPLRLIAATSTNISPAHYRWDYEAGSPTDIPITATLNRCPAVLAPANPNSLLDFETLWVKAGTTPPEDWTVRLEHVLADAFDVPRRLLDALQANLERRRDSGQLAWPVDKTFHDAFMASLHDVANAGLALPPERRTLAEALVHGLDGDVEGTLRMLGDYERRSYGTQANWVTRVSGFVDAVERITPFPMAPSADLAEYGRALEHLYTVFSTESNLLAFVLSEWDGALGSTGFWQKHRATITARLRDVQLRKRLLLGNVGLAWRDLAGDLHDPKALVQTVQTVFERYIAGRFVSPPQQGYGAYLPATTKAPADALPHILAYLETFVHQAVLPRKAGQDAGDPQDPGSVREDLVIQIDRLQREAKDGQPDDHDDFLRRLAGLGVLLRRKGATDRSWRCLSLAELEINETGTSLDVGAVPVPLRLGYRGGLRSSFLTYTNQPMAAESPSAALSHHNKLQDARDDNDRAKMIRYRNPYSFETGPRLEGLTYGEAYEAAVFLIGNAGNLPVQLAGADTQSRRIPWRFQLPSLDPPHIQTIPYKRRVPVGEVRLCAKNSTPGAPGEMERLPVPPIPDTVLPLTRSLHVPNARAQERDREDTLILLTPSDDHWPAGRDQFAFGVRPPSAPLEVWDRWVTKDRTEETRVRRGNVWGLYHHRADVNQDGGTKGSSSDLTIDDPAVEAIELTFEQLYPLTATGNPVRVPFTRPTDSCRDSLRCVQADPIEIRIAAATKLEIPTTAISPIVIGIPAGEVWKIQIRPVISEPGRFDAQAGDTGRPITLLIEIADRLFKDDDEHQALASRLTAALQPAVVLDGSELDVPLVLDRKADRFRDRIHRVELLLQRWRWDGRPVSYFDSDDRVHYRFPFRATASELEAFDGTLFASRDSTDHLVIPAHVDFASSSAASSAARLFRTDLSTLPGALYFRMGVRAFSRYEGLLLSETHIDSRRRVDRNTPEAWRRLVVPCRWNKPVPRPAVKLVLPLTYAPEPTVLSATSDLLQPGGGDELTGTAGSGALATDTTGSSGLLIVLDESWYSDTLGGVAEVLEWDLARVALPEVANQSRLEAGPDPVLDMSPDPLAGREVRAHQAIGAIGYTQDTGTTAPLFTRASFVIPAPEVDGLADLSWFFLKLQFRRMLERPTGAAVSSWTDPVWCQLLPPSNCVRIGSRLTPTSKLRFNATTGSFINVETRDTVVPLPTAVAACSRSRFTLWALVTRPVVDALGRANQEAFVGLKALRDGAIDPFSEQVIVRLLELQERIATPCPDGSAPAGSDVVQAAAGIRTEADLLAALFPESADVDARARVVRMTPPIPQK